MAYPQVLSYKNDNFILYGVIAYEGPEENQSISRAGSCKHVLYLDRNLSSGGQGSAKISLPNMNIRQNHRNIDLNFLKI